MSRFSLDPPDEDEPYDRAQKCLTRDCDNTVIAPETLCNVCHVLMHERRERRIRESNDEIFVRAMRREFQTREQD